MSKSKTFRLEVNDVFDELKDENNRLNQQILLFEKTIKLLDQFSDNMNEFYNCCKCEVNLKNQNVFNDLRNQYKTVSDEFRSVNRSTHLPQYAGEYVQRSKRDLEDRPLLLVSKSSIQKSIKREVSSETDEDFDRRSDDFDDENLSLNYDKEVKQPIDNSMYLMNDSNCGKSLTIDSIDCNKC